MEDRTIKEFNELVWKIPDLIKGLEKNENMIKEWSKTMHSMEIRIGELLKKNEELEQKLKLNDKEFASLENEDENLNERFKEVEQKVKNNGSNLANEVMRLEQKIEEINIRQNHHIFAFHDLKGVLQEQLEMWIDPPANPEEYAVRTQEHIKRLGSKEKELGSKRGYKPIGGVRRKGEEKIKE